MFPSHQLINLLCCCDRPSNRDGDRGDVMQNYISNLRNKYVCYVRISLDWRIVFFFFLSFSPTILIVDRPRVFATGTFIEYCLPFIDAAQLDGIIIDFRRAAFDARLLDRHSGRFVRVLSQTLLFRIGFRP